MKKLLVITFLLLSFYNYGQETITLWPKGKMPNSKGLVLQHIEERERVTQVATPNMVAFLPPKEEANGAAVLICPGGGYHHLTYNLGGYQLAKWLNTQGIAAFVLFYRLPTSPDLINKQEGPIQDVQRAMKIIRANAASYNVDVNKVGIMGTSAGGHLASVLGTHTTDFSNIKDSISNFKFTPDFMILVSAVISMEAETHKGSVENFLGKNASESLKMAYSTNKQVSATTPPTFLAHAQNDPAVPVTNTLRFYNAMLQHNVAGCLYIAPAGEHKIGIYNASELTDQWKNLCTAWLKEKGFISPL